MKEHRIQQVFMCECTTKGPDPERGTAPTMAEELMALGDLHVHVDDNLTLVLDESDVLIYDKYFSNAKMIEGNRVWRGLELKYPKKFTRTRHKRNPPPCSS